MHISLSLIGLGEKPIVPIADLSGNKKYSAQEIECRNKLATLYRLIDRFQWTQSIYNHITLRLPGGSENEILINPFGMAYKEITASALVKISVDGDVIDPGSTNLGINQAGYILHSAIHKARPDLKCVLHLHTAAGTAVSMMECGFLPLIQEAMIVGPVAYHVYHGALTDEEERNEIAKHLGDKKVIFFKNHGFAACGGSIEEAFHLAYETLIGCATQVNAMTAGLQNLVLPKPEAVNHIFEFAKHGGNGLFRIGQQNGKMEHTWARLGDIEWGIGELEWEAWMRQLDGAGYQTGHNYKLPAMMEFVKKRAKK